jgi:hypothetical protein
VAGISTTKNEESSEPTAMTKKKNQHPPHKTEIRKAKPHSV